MIEFEWDPSKAERNEQKHGVSFEEAKSVFYDEYAVQFFNEEHSGVEDRFILLGVSLRLRLLVVCHCERGDGAVIRLMQRERRLAESRSTTTVRYER